MKKIILTAILAVSIAATSFAAGKNTITNIVKNHFNAEFSNAEDVQWSATNSYAVATFLTDNKRMKAFYDFDGSLIGTSQGITIESLPSFAKRAYAKKYANYLVKEAIRFDDKNDTAYYISASNEKESVVVKITGGQMTTLKKS